MVLGTLNTTAVPQKGYSHPQSPAAPPPVSSPQSEVISHGIILESSRILFLNRTPVHGSWKHLSKDLFVNRAPEAGAEEQSRWDQIKDLLREEARGFTPRSERRLGSRPLGQMAERWSPEFEESSFVLGILGLKEDGWGLDSWA